MADTPLLHVQMIKPFLDEAGFKPDNTYKEICEYLEKLHQESLRLKSLNSR